MTKTKYVKTILLAGVMLFLTVQKGSGFLLILLLPVLVVMMLYHAVKMVRKPEERRNRGVRLAVWGLAFLLAGGVQSYWSAASRKDAETALQKILTYKERTGTYPAGLKEVGLDDAALEAKWKLRYSLKDGMPMLVYPATFVWMDLHEYDFDKRTWRENAY